MVATGIAFHFWLSWNPDITAAERVSVVVGWVFGWLFRSYLANEDR